jgi:hypothetical protein
MPTAVGEHPAGGGEQDSVACGESKTAGLATQDPKLMPQYEDLQVLGAVVARGRTSRRVSRRTVNQSRKSHVDAYIDRTRLPQAA